MLMLQMEVCDDLGVDLHFTSSSVSVMEAEEVLVSRCLPALTFHRNRQHTALVVRSRVHLLLQTTYQPIIAHPSSGGARTKRGTVVSQTLSRRAFIL